MQMNSSQFGQTPVPALATQASNDLRGKRCYFACSNGSRENFVFEQLIESGWKKALHCSHRAANDKFRDGKGLGCWSYNWR